MHRQPDSDLLRSRNLAEPVGQVPDLPSSAPTAPWQVGDLPHVAHTVSTTIENTGPTSGGLRIISTLLIEAPLLQRTADCPRHQDTSVFKLTLPSWHEL